MPPCIVNVFCAPSSEAPLCLTSNSAKLYGMLTNDTGVEISFSDATHSPSNSIGFGNLVTYIAAVLLG